jgi:peroxiredoxin Q/BCP
MAAFAERFKQFGEAGAQVLGISTDDLDTQKRFAESLKLPFPLLSDEKGEVAAAYGVRNATGLAQRFTFVINAKGVIEQVLEGKDALDPSGALAACQKSK